MILFNPPQPQGFVRTTIEGHRQVADRPEFNAAVWGRNLEDLDQTIAFQMNDQPVPWNQYVANRLVARVRGIYQAIRFQLGQPRPVQVADQFQVVQTGVLTVEAGQVRLKPTDGGSQQHCPKVVIFAQLVVRLIVYPKVTGSMRFAIRPQQADQVDALHHLAMFARPMPRDQVHRLRIKLVQRTIINHQHTAHQAAARPHFLPQRLAIRLTPVLQTRVGVMRGTVAVCGRMTFGCLGIAENFLRGNQELNVVKLITLGWVHTPKYKWVMPTA
jgi:hypothetical protein